MCKRRTTTDTREWFGYVLNRRREDLQLSQKDLAEKARIHRTYLSDVERGTQNVSLFNVERIAESLRWKISELFQRMEMEWEA